MKLLSAVIVIGCFFVGYASVTAEQRPVIFEEELIRALRLEIQAEVDKKLEIQKHEWNEKLRAKNEEWNQKLQANNDVWEMKLKIRDENISQLRYLIAKTEAQCAQNPHDPEVTSRKVVAEINNDDDIQDSIDELKLKVADLEDEDKDLHIEIENNRLDLFVVHDDIFSLNTKTNELASNHSKDHDLLIGLVQENTDSIGVNLNFIQENEESIASNYNDLDERLKYIEQNALPCEPDGSHYNVLNDASRSYDNTSGEGFLCDTFDDSDCTPSPDWKGEGWYRIAEPAGTILSRTKDPEGQRCNAMGAGTYAGEYPTGQLEELDGTVCFGMDGDSCVWNVDIKVKNCGSFYIYYLKDAFWYSRYCTE